MLEQKRKGTQTMRNKTMVTVYSESMRLYSNGIWWRERERGEKNNNGVFYFVFKTEKSDSFRRDEWEKNVKINPLFDGDAALESIL